MLRQLLQLIRNFFLPRRALEQAPSERRRLVRVRCRIPIQIRQGERTLSGWIVDMGVQGLRIRTSQLLKRGLTIPVRATLSQQASQAWVSCRVMWSRPASESGRGSFLAGARFGETRDNLRRTWVHRLLRELGLDDNSLRERREFIRAWGKIPVRFEALEPEGETGLGLVETLNVGVAGLLVRTSGTATPGHKFRCWVGPWEQLPEVGPIPAEVLACRPEPSGSASQVPLRFLELEEDTVHSLGRYVLTLLKEA